MSRSWQMVVCVAACVACVGCAPSGGAARGAWLEAPEVGPFASSGAAPVVAQPVGDVWGEAAREGAARSGMMELAFAIYRDHITKVDGPRCEHRPTCSRYAIEAMRRHGFVVGAMMGVDRLLRTGRSSSLRALPLLRVIDGQPYYSDPVEENDFFF